MAEDAAKKKKQEEEEMGAWCHVQLRKVGEIAVDYNPEVCEQREAEGEIVVRFDEIGGARWRSLRRYQRGVFSAKIRCPAGNTSGLNCSFYLSSLEGDKSQDEIDFEFLGNNKHTVQTNYYTRGLGNREMIHDLGFDSSAGFHEYAIRWAPDRRRVIEWLVDGIVIRRCCAQDASDPFPSLPMFLYASVWNAGDIDEGRWAGKYLGSDAPYFCTYKDVHVPDE